MSLKVTSGTTLALTPHARFYRKADQYVLVTPNVEYTFSQRSAEIFDKVKFLLEGSHDLGAVAEIADVPFGELSETLRLLVDERALTDVSALLSARTAEQLLAAYFPICDEWALDIFSYPFWQLIMSGQASRELVIGWGLEFYHRVMGADEHNAIALNFCQDETVRQWLTAHFAEEADHGFIFLDGLSGCGLDRQNVIESPPLPSTRALINYLNALAATDLIAYLGCYGVMHSPRVGQTRERIDLQYDLLKQHYTFAFPLLNKIHEHAAVDIDLGHDGIVFERVIKRQTTVDAETAIKILGAVKGIVTAFVCFFGGINEYYQSPAAQFPRRANSITAGSRQDPVGAFRKSASHRSESVSTFTSVD